MNGCAASLTAPSPSASPIMPRICWATWCSSNCPGRALKGGQECAVVESVKAASDVYAPLAGEVVAVNEALNDSPELVNKDPYGEGWMMRIRPNVGADVDALLDADFYQAQIESEAS